MITSLKKSEPIDYSNNNWYANIYHYYIDQQFLSIDHIKYTVIKK